MPTIMITGANRGLGLEFARQYLADGYEVIATCRHPDSAEALRSLDQGAGRLCTLAMDFFDLESVEAGCSQLDGRPIDILLNNAAVFGPKPKADGDLGQNFSTIDFELWADIFRINTMAPLRLAECLIENILSGTEKKIVSMSSQVASMTEGGPGLYLYRSSKTALNMTMKTLAHELAEHDVIVTLFNPGWVKTDMGGDAATLEVSESIAAVRSQVSALTMSDTGAFIDYDGRRIPW